MPDGKYFPTTLEPRFIHIPPSVTPTCPACQSEMALQMVERPMGYVCLTCHPPVRQYVPIAEHEALKAQLEAVTKERDELRASGTQVPVPVMITADDIYALVALTPPNDDRAADLLLGWIDDLCLEGKFDEANAVLLGLDLERLDSYLTVGMLSNAYACGLTCFDDLYPKVRAKLTALVPDRVDMILKGLTPELAAKRRAEYFQR